MRRALRREPRRKPRPWPAEAVAARRDYAGRLTQLTGEAVACAAPLPLHVFSFSSERDLPEQVASIRSFLAHAGTPDAFTIISDGSHTDRGRYLLRAIHPCIETVEWKSLARPGLPPAVWDYARISWRGKKLIALVSLTVERPLLYADADILFFEGASELRQLARDAKTGPRYLRDCAGDRWFLDRRMLLNGHEAAESINSGFMFVPEPLDWTPALRRLERQLRWLPATFAAQTVVHLTLHGVGAHPFDPSRYVVADDDRALPEDPYVGPETVLRHYVTPVRHKFWTMQSRLAPMTH